jgi:hypothetical protein
MLLPLLHRILETTFAVSSHIVIAIWYIGLVTQQNATLIKKRRNNFHINKEIQMVQSHNVYDEGLPNI